MKALSYIIIVLFYCQTLSAQNFNVNISNDTILIGNYVELSFTIEDIEGEFSAPDLEGFEIVSGPNVSSTMHIINGAKTSKKTYSYFVKPKELGKFLIQPAYVLSIEDKWETQAIEVEVIPNPDNLIIIPEQKRSIFFSKPIIPMDEPIQKDTMNKKPKKKLKRL